MSIDELMAAVLALIPSAEFGEDNDRQIVIYTNMFEDQQGNVQKFD